MEKRNGKKQYSKPVVISEKVFEQAALACSQLPYGGVAPNFSVKASSAICGFASS